MHFSPLSAPGGLLTDDPAIDGNHEKHYITIFMNVVMKPESAELANLEPHKCEGWEWVTN